MTCINNPCSYPNCAWSGSKHECKIHTKSHVEIHLQPTIQEVLDFSNLTWQDMPWPKECLSKLLNFRLQTNRLPTPPCPQIYPSNVAMPLFGLVISSTIYALGRILNKTCVLQQALGSAFRGKNQVDLERKVVRMAS